VFGSIAAPDRSTVDRNTWEYDGAGKLGRFGVLTPEFDPVPESELWSMLPRGFSLHASRLPRVGGRGAGMVAAPSADEAVDRLVELRPSAILLGYTSSSYALGAKADEQVRVRLQERAKGIEVIFSAPSAVAALRAFRAHRICVLHPPWWTEAASEQGRSYFLEAGFEVLVCKRMQPDRQFSEVDPAEVFNFVVEQTPQAADAVFLGGNGMRVIGTIRSLEKKLGRPVLTANQVLLWNALSRVGSSRAVARYGSLFSRRP
jgi:maleate isomerase